MSIEFVATVGVIAPNPVGSRTCRVGSWVPPSLLGISRWSYDVELDPVDRGVVVDRAGVRGPGT